MKQLYKKLSAWMILIGLFLQITTPAIAALQSSHSMSSNTVISGKSGVSVKNHLSELQDTESVDVANFNVHGLIEQIVEDAVEQGYENNLSSALMRCYKSVSEGETVLDADILIEAIPELLQYAIEQEKIRASRPDAPTSNANNAIVACGGDCDLTQLIRLLASIRARIGTVNDSPCCGTILGILGDACNVPCIGENGSISEVLCEILDCCTQITGSSAINVDLSGVYTAIADLKTTLTECCAEIHVEFNGVFTVLAGLDFDCSTTVEIDLNGVFTVLANLDLNCSTTVEIDLSGVFTVLADIKSDIFDTQTLIIDGFEGTWTILEDCCACGPIPLFQSDVVGGVINLTTTGLNYCLAENITGNIIISGGNVTVDGNDRVLTGRVEINAADVIFKNAKVKTPAPGNNTEAAFAAIHIMTIGTNAQILNCLVECDPTIISFVNGRTGILSEADKTIVDGCKVVGGFGGGDALAGNGIEIVGNNGFIKNSRAAGGRSSGPLGISGNGIEVSGDDELIENSIAMGGHNLNGAGGNGIFVSDSNTVVIKGCLITEENISFIGRYGIHIDGTSQNIQICDCKIDNVGAGTNSPRNAIQVDSGALCVQVVSNRVSCCPGIGINNLAGTQATFYNNIVTDCNPNYVGVSLIRVPGPQTGFFTNVTQGEQDCDLCDLFTVIQTDFEGTWTILANLDLNCSTTVEIDLNGVFTVLANLDLSCTAEVDLSGVYTVLANLEVSCTAEVDLSGVYTVLANLEVSATVDLSGVYTVLEGCCACEPVPLFQSDVDPVTNAILLTVSGVSYCLAENITGTISITGDNVTIEGNNRLVTGRIFINASEVVVKDTNVQAPGIADNSEMSFAGIHIAGGADNQIVNCVVKCNAAPGSLGIAGRTAIFSAGTRTRVLRSEAVGGNGGFINPGIAGNGGAGIRITAATAFIEDSLGIGGNGGQANGANSTGGNGGNGIDINGVDGLINNSRGFGGSGGVAGLQSGGVGVNIGGNGGIGILLNGNNGIIKNSEGKGGNGNGAISGVGGTSGTGGDGISTIGSFGVIEDSAGTGGNGGSGFVAGVPGGAGGIGIRITGQGLFLNNLIATGGNGGNGGNDTTAGNGGSGILLLVGSSTINISNSVAAGGNGGDGSGAGIGGMGGAAVTLSSTDVVIADSKLFAGDGGSSAANGGIAGSCVSAQNATRLTLANLSMVGGNGGDGGGDGGGSFSCVDIFSMDTVIIKSCFVDGRGSGGNSTGGGNGGAGADGIDIRGGSSNIQIEDCVINNVGLGGTGVVSGANGNGIQIDSDSECVQVVSNRVSCCPGIGINNDAGTESTFYNNIVTDCNPNYVGVPLVRVPGPQTGFFTNVTQGEQDCDLCDVFTVLGDCCACESVPLFQSDVDPVTNAILLTVSGVSYCLAENITGTISITGDNVTIEGNNRLVTGRIFINASEVIIKDTNVQAPGVADVSEMSFAGIHIAGGSDNQIVNCVVTCDAAPNSSLGATGRTGIFSAGIRTRILDSDAVGGNGGAATNVGSSGGNGGIGIQINATDGLINTSRGLGGVGGGALGGTGINTGGNGGIGILLSGDHGIIKDSEGKGGNGGGAFSDPGGAGGVGGSGIRMTGVIGAIENSAGIGGDGGVGVTGGTVGGAGGIGIDINGDKYAIRSSQAIGGSGVQGFGGGSGGIGLKILGSNALINDATITGGDAGVGNAATNGGGGGAGIELPVGANFVDIFNSIVTGGNGGNAGGNGGDAGSGMNINIPNVRVADSEIRGGSGGNGNTGGSAAVGIDVLGGASNVTISGSTLIGGNGGTGSIAAGGGNGHAIAIQGNDVIVADSKLFAGNGASGATNGGNGGSGIVILGNNITVNNLVINAGNGGSGSANGGNGGNGINIGVSSSDIKTVIIRACTIMDGGVGGTGGTPGNGGHGIFVSSSLSFIVSDIQISDCTINNVGQATAPGIGGDGIRIDSADTDNPSTCIQVINTQIIGSAGNGLYIIAGSNIEVKECSATCNGIDGFVIDNGGGIIFDSLNSLHNLSAGIHTGGNSFDIQIKDCKAEANGTDGILVEAAATQVISCCATSNTSFGINNLGGTVATYYNNVATNNLGGNYSGVSLVRVPGPQTGFYTNVAQGQQDCDLCDLFTVVADISDTQTLLMAGFEGTWTILGDCCACGPIPLFQSDVVGGAITLSTTGMNYCLAENITGTIVVTGGNITIEGNDRVLTGRIRIDAADPIVKNIKVKPAAPADNTEAAFAAIDITSNGSNAQILNCLIVCANSTVSGVVGRSGIITAATKTWVKDCNITAGAAATVTAGAATTAVGGSGIVISGSFGLISDSLAIAGAGSTNDVVASLGGAGGIGVQISGANGLILNSKFIGGNGGAAGPNPDPGNSTGGAGGRGGDVTGADIQVVDSEFTGGSGGVIPSGAGTTTGGFGGVGFSMASLNGQFLNSNATGGLGGNSASNTSTGGAGGAAFGIGTDNVEVRNSTLIGASGGTGVTGGAGGQGVGIGANNIMMADTKLIAGSGANGTATGGGSGFGITAQSCNRITFLNLIVIGGNGGTGGTGLGGTALSSIDIVGCNVVLVKACNIIDGSNGGNGGTTGGNGGSGILVRGNSVDVQISECRVERVGAAGTGGAPTPGNGIDISTGTNVQVTSNYVSGCPGNGVRTAGGTNHQVMSNRVSACTLIGFLNGVGTQAVFANNAATLNAGGNYSGVAPVDSIAAPVSPANLNYWTNVTP